MRPVRRFFKYLVCALVPALLLAVPAGCGAGPVGNGYGVFLSVTEGLDKLPDMQTCVIDAQYFSKEEISAFSAGGKKVFSYLNIGSIEDFRPYFEEYRQLSLGEYEHWEGEYWMDVSSPLWQSFIEDELVPSLLAKGVDGFFVDNCDVYYEYQTQEILDGLTGIMRFLTGTGKEVIINGGDVFLDACCAAGCSAADVITGINQETVFSSILWDGDRFGKASAEDRDYYTDYIERYAAQGADIYLLEYTRDRSLIAQIRDYCEKNGFKYYISDSVELD